MTFDSNTFFPFQVHVIQHLVHHIPVTNGAGGLQKPVGQGGFAVIYVGDDTEIANILHYALYLIFRMRKGKPFE